MIQFLEELSGETNEEHDAEEWTRMIDRGGLWQINDDVCSFLLLWKKSDKLKANKGLSQ